MSSKPGRGLWVYASSYFPGVYVFLIHSLRLMLWNWEANIFFLLIQQFRAKKMGKDIIGTRRCHQAMRLGLLPLFFFFF